MAGFALFNFLSVLSPKVTAAESGTTPAAGGPAPAAKGDAGGAAGGKKKTPPAATDKAKPDAASAQAADVAKGSDDKAENGNATAAAIARVNAAKAAESKATKAETDARTALVALLRPHIATDAPNPQWIELLHSAEDDSDAATKLADAYVGVFVLKDSHKDLAAIFTAETALKAAVSEHAAKTKATKSASDDLWHQFGIGKPLINILVFVGSRASTSSSHDTIDRNCRSGMLISDLSKETNLLNVTRQEGGTPVGKEEGRDTSLFHLEPDTAILIMAAEYKVVWNETSHELENRCSQTLTLGGAGINDIQLWTLGYSKSKGNRVDLISPTLRSDINVALESKRHVIMPVRDFMQYQASSAPEEVLRNGQEVRLDIVRNMSDAERDRRQVTAQDASFALRWRFPLDDMPGIFVHIPLMLGLAPRGSGSTSVWSFGPAVSIGARTGGEYYFGAELLLHFSKTVSAPSGFPSFLWGAGIQFDLSGYLGIGGEIATDTQFDRAVWMVTITPLPWVSQALGLEKIVNAAPTTSP